MNKFRIYIFMLMMIGLAPSVSLASQCKPPSSANVQVLLLDPEPRITNNKSLQQINSMAAVHGLIKHGNHALGTTQSAVEISLSIKFVGFQHIRNQKTMYCLNIGSVKARFGHKILVVNLPREYPVGSCQYNVVRRHEMAHVTVNRQGVRKYAMVLKSKLEREIMRLGTLDVRTMSRGTDAFQSRLKAVYLAVSKQFDGEIQKFHRAIDAPNSPYAATNACRSW